MKIEIKSRDSRIDDDARVIVDLMKSSRYRFTGNDEKKAAYEAKFGPITKTSAAAGSSYRWLQDPWPWNFGQNEVK